MCGRYSTGASPEELARELDAELSPEAAAAPARFNVAPSQPAPMLVAVPERRLGLARFGWTVPRRKPLLVNARIEGVEKNGLFRSAGERHRALVPADGFYEWTGVGKDKRAYYFRGGESPHLTFAALFDVGRDAEGEKPARAPSFVILTRPAEGVIARIHDRMPVVVPVALRDLWLSREPLEEAIAAAMAARPELECWEVSSRVGSPKLDEPWLRDAIGPPPDAPA